MLIGYVSDENFVAIPDVAVEIQRGGKFIAATHSTATGAIYADLSPGKYRITLSKNGYGAKWSHASIDPAKPWQFRLLSDSIYGYAWPKWNRSGQKSEFRIHSPEGYHLSLWRYGKKKELVRNLGVFDEHGPRPCLQILPDGDFTQNGVGWNRFGYDKRFSLDTDGGAHKRASTEPHCLSQVIAAPEKSGLYFFHVETYSGRFINFPWVIAPATPQSSIAVLASTNTWNAYNNFGGRSNYINPTELRSQPTINARLDLGRYIDRLSIWSARDEDYRPLSFDRPEPFSSIPQDAELNDPIRSRQGCHLIEAEWKLFGWLEREGFDYDLYSDYQLHAGQLDLDAYKVLIISTHPEYWSRDAYLKVKQWVFERGGKLMYLGGNGIDCEVELPDEASMRCKTWLPNPPGALVFTEPKTGKIYECRFHHNVESPAELLGVVFTEPGCGNSAPFRVMDASHWLYAGTGLKRGDVFGADSLHERCPGGASGHETDKLSASSPRNAKLLARGLNPDAGGAEVVLHETKTGGAVFSVGSITWPACVLVDKQISRITRNVIERFTASSRKRAATIKRTSK